MSASDPSLINSRLPRRRFPWRKHWTRPSWAICRTASVDARSLGKSHRRCQNTAWIYDIIYIYILYIIYIIYYIYILLYNVYKYDIISHTVLDTMCMVINKLYIYMYIYIYVYTHTHNLWQSKTAVWRTGTIFLISPADGGKVLLVALAAESLAAGWMRMTPEKPSEVMLY